MMSVGMACARLVPSLQETGVWQLADVALVIAPSPLANRREALEAQQVEGTQRATYLV